MALMSCSRTSLSSAPVSSKLSPENGTNYTEGGRREGGRVGGKERGWEGRRESGKEGRREGGRGREGGKEREGRKGREGEGRSAYLTIHLLHSF